MAAKKTRASEQRRRTSRHIVPIKPLVHVVCEGQTEQAYLRALLQHRYQGMIAINEVSRVRRSGSRGSSIKNLLDAAKRFERGKHDRYLAGDPIWIVCDADPENNASHADALAKWLADQHHHAAVQASAIEGWFVLHFVDKHPYSPRAALEALGKHWSGYSKGAEIGVDLIAKTDEACERERTFTESRSADGPWPPAGCARMSDLIECLDALASRVGWKNPDEA